MSNKENIIVLLDGKYSVVNENGILTAFRYGESWPEKSHDLIGDGFVLALVGQIEELRSQVGVLKKHDVICMSCRHWRYTSDGSGECMGPTMGKRRNVYTDEGFYCKDGMEKDE